MGRAKEHIGEWASERAKRIADTTIDRMFENLVQTKMRDVESVALQIFQAEDKCMWLVNGRYTEYGLIWIDRFGCAYMRKLDHRKVWMTNKVYDP